MSLLHIFKVRLKYSFFYLSPEIHLWIIFFKQCLNSTIISGSMVLWSRDNLYQPKRPAAALQQKADMPAAASETALCHGIGWGPTHPTDDISQSDKQAITVPDSPRMCTHKLWESTRSIMHPSCTSDFQIFQKDLVWVPSASKTTIENKNVPDFRNYTESTYPMALKWTVFRSHTICCMVRNHYLFF